MKPGEGYGRAWVALALALAVHVADEALNDFLPLYNAIVESINPSLPFPLPTFTFGVWLGGLILGVVLLLALSRFAFRGARWMIPLSYFLGVMMTGNGLLHFAGSYYLLRAMPGVYSSPLLLACSGWLLVETYKFHRRGSGEGR